jgi:formylmethanofuran dehydrogenase subunit B
MVALARTSKPITGAEVTIAIGKAGVDHDAVVYSARTGTLTFLTADAASELPSAASILRTIAEHIPAGAELPC